jgi:hypothetical protein
MKQKEIVTRDYMQIISLVEKSINKNLVSPGSLGKFVFRVIFPFFLLNF